MIKVLKNSIRDYKFISIITAIFVVIEIFLDILIPIIMKNLVDNGIEKGNTDLVIKYGILLVILSLFALLFGFLSGKSASVASNGFVKNLRSDMFKKINEFSFADIDKFSTASLITRLTTDANNVQGAYQMIIRIAVRTPLMFIFSLGAVIMLSPKLSTIFIIIIPILCIGLYFITTNAYPNFSRAYKKYDKLNKVVEENIKGIRVVKSFNNEENEIKKFKNVSGGIYKDFSKAEKIISLNTPLMEGTIYLSIIILSWVGGKMIVESGNTIFTTGDLMAMFTYTVMILNSLMMLSGILVMLNISRASAKRIVEVLTLSPTLKNNNDGIKTVENGDIEFNNVYFKYNDKQDKYVLNNINLKIESGEFIGIIGQTGSSKSTLVSLISRLYDPSSGTVKVGKVPTNDYDIKSLRDGISIVLQKNTLFRGTIIDNLKMGCKDASMEEIISVCKIAQIHDFIESLPLKYNTIVEEGGTNFSGGQKQRLTIARALLKKAKIIIFDDSTSAVDTKTEKLISDTINKELSDVTKIIITQRISSILNADKVIVLDDGKINSFDTPSNLLKKCKIYRDMYNSQIKGDN